MVRKVGRERGIRTATGAAGRLGGGGGGGRLARRLGKEKDGKEKEKGYDYVEVMACPSGCVNGGGQLKPREVDEEKHERDWEDSGVQMGKWGDKGWTRKVEMAYWTDPRAGDGDQRLDDADHTARKVIQELCGNDRDRRHSCLRTQYRAVESEVVGLAVKW